MMRKAEIAALIEEQNKRLADHFADVVYVHSVPACSDDAGASSLVPLSVFCNGEEKPEGQRVKKARSYREAIVSTVDAVIARFPKGSTAYVRSPLTFDKWPAAPAPWPGATDRPAGFSARIRLGAA